MKRKISIGFASAICLHAASPAFAAACRNSGSFESWLSNFRQEAQAQGISQRTLAEAAPYMVYDSRIVGIDRGQKVFNKTFLEFSNHLIPAYRLQKGLQLLKQHASEFSRI